MRYRYLNCRSCPFADEENNLCTRYDIPIDDQDGCVDAEDEYETYGSEC